MNLTDTHPGCPADAPPAYPIGPVLETPAGLLAADYECGECGTAWTAWFDRAGFLGGQSIATVKDAPARRAA